MIMKPLRGLYDWTMDKASHPHAVGWLAFFCFVESSFFPIPPHPLLGLMCLAEPKKAVKFALVATLASVAGALLGYAIGWGLYGNTPSPLNFTSDPGAKSDGIPAKVLTPPRQHRP